MKLPRGSFANFDRIAIRVRVSMGLRDIDPIDPRKVCEHYEIALIKLSTLPETNTDRYAAVRDGSQKFYSGHTFTRNGQRVIVYNDFDSAYRQNSTISHELAHCFLNHANTRLRSETGDRKHVKMEEAQAAALSGYLLMTNAACWHVVSQNLQHTAQTVYGVSPDMLELRLRKSGVRKRLASSRAKVSF
jgi:Zn-dependent peptidase ImmA (M78 family)